MTINIGDASLRFTAHTEDLDKKMNDLLDKLERTVQAARQAWNAEAKKEAEPAA